MPEIRLRSLRHTGTDGFSPSAPFSCPPFSAPFVPGTDPVSFTCISISIVPNSPAQADQALQHILWDSGFRQDVFLVSSSHIPARLVPCLFRPAARTKISSHILYGSCASLPTLQERFRKHPSGITDLTSDPEN